MADLLKPAFRSSFGLDAAGEKVINVADTDFSVLDDGVNVNTFIRENTIQQYDTTRAYKKNFAVIFDNRIWVANQDIAAPAGTFQELRWTSLRTDPKWSLVNTAGEKQLQSGQFVSVDTSTTPVSLKLPMTPQDGDTIFIKDIGGKVSVNALKISISNQNIVEAGKQVSSVLITKPFSYTMLIFSNRLWQQWTGVDSPRAVYVSRAGGDYQASSGDDLVRTHSDPGPITVILPKNANNGDVIRFTDLDGLAPLNHLIIKTYDATTSVGQSGKTQIESRTSADGKAIYDAPSKLWRLWDGDIRTRLRIIREDVTLLPNESVMVIGDDNVTVKTVKITLPKDVANGDKVEIALNYMRYNMTAEIIAPTGSILATSKALLQFPRRSDYPPPGQWAENTSISFSGATDYVPTLELSYVLIDGNAPRWVVSENIPTIERVDATADNTRARLGVIALATQGQANADKGSNPEKELAITPETLANRTANETRQGIARIANQSEANGTTDDETIVTPLKLNNRIATETRRGVTEVATQGETDAGTDDFRYITPKKLNDRKATEILPGIIGIVTTGATTKAGVNRTTPGTNVYDSTDNTKAITPKSLNENKATYTSQGGVFLATETEVIAGTQHAEATPTVVTPVELQKKTATETRIGFSEIATQSETDAGTDDFRIVTPKKLNDRKASNLLDGIIRLSTQPEFDAGILDNVASPPLRIKNYFSGNRLSVNSDSGLTGTGNIWDHYTVDIKEASNTQRGTARLATQGEVNTGTEAKSIVTPATLNAKKATEGTEGIVQIASESETVSGLLANKAVSPKNLKFVAQSEVSWEATPARRGFVKISENTITFVGNDTQGSTQALDLYSKNGYAISPYELNKTLANFLPKKAVAVNSVLFNGKTDTQFVRSDIDQTVNGSLTLTKQLNTSAPVVSTSTAKFTVVNATTSVDVGNQLGAARINLDAKDNNWDIDTVASGTYLDFNSDIGVLRLTRTGDAIVNQTISAGNKVEAVNGYSAGGTIVINPTASEIVIGSTLKKTTLATPDASTFTVTDTTGNHTILTTKNMVTQVGLNFVKKIGDTMTGKLSLTAPVAPIITEAQAVAPLTAATTGVWSAEITTLSVYEKLPGYVVPDVIADGHTVSYRQVVSSGTLSQLGTSATYTYQIWTPRPTGTATAGHNANTMWTRVWDVSRNAWGQWNRIFTSEAPPTANDIGAVSSSGSAFDNLTIRDWIQIGNVRIRPNTATRSVDFDWIE